MIFSRGRQGGRHAKTEEPATETVEVETPPVGPYDISEAPAGVSRLDLGSLHIPAVPGIEVRVQANPDGSIQQIVLVSGESALQLGVFAAPRTEGIWDEVRAEIRESLLADGAVVDETEGEYGAELLAQAKTPDGVTRLRFVGVDGPRWMVRAVYQGPAAVEAEPARPLTECLHGLVVDRGGDARPVRDPLPLRMPKDVVPAAETQA